MQHVVGHSGGLIDPDPPTSGSPEVKVALKRREEKGRTRSKNEDIPRIADTFLTIHSL